MAGVKTNVAVIGGSGMLGKHLVHGFLNNGGYKVTVVTRKGGDVSKLAPFTSKGALVAEVDLSDHASLTHGFKGQDIVVSTVGTAALADQPKYIEAAKAAGVKRFVPSEFGMDTGAPGVREYFPLLGYKYATRDALQASGLEYTYIITGFFLETQFTGAFFFDVPNGKATVKGNPDKAFTVTSLSDVGKWTAEALLDPASKNSTVYLQGEVLTYNQAVKTIEEATGKKLEVTHVSAKELDEHIAAAPNPFASFLDLLLRAINDGWGIIPAPGTKPFRGPSDASTNLAKYAKTATFSWSDA